MKRLLRQLLILTSLAGSLLMAAGVKVQVSSTRIAPGQSLRVKLIAEGNDALFPDIQKVGPYPVENQRRVNKIESRFANGKLVTQSQKILSFEIYPRKSVTIPPLTVVVDGKKYTTRPVKVEVVKGAGVGGAGGFAIRMKVDKSSLYQGEPLILTVDAVEPLQSGIAQMQYTPPAFKGFFVKPLGGERQIHQGETTIHRLQYLLTPQKAGTLRIDPASLRVGIRDLNAPGDPFGIFGSPLKWVALRSNPLTVSVKPLPIQADLVGHFEVKAKVDKTRVKANEPVNYTLEILGEGSLEDLNDPRFDIPGVTVYSDDAVVKSTVKNGKLYSSWRKKYVFISDRDFTIPALKLTEFDYADGKKRILKTQPFSIHVSGGKAAGAVPPAPKGMKAQPSQPAAAATAPKFRAKSTAENLLEDPAYYARKAYEAKAARLPWYLAGAFLAGMGVMFLILQLWKRRPRGSKRGVLGGGRHYGTEEALKILYPHINDDPAAEAMVRQLYRKQAGEEVEIDRKELDRLAARYDREFSASK
ncbi:BatD family protein [Nitratifractor sp.]|uniref:BatD family protein n=1 Tax=Nitratifractor sp. TaxID=2268144 RepID=UPI0025DA36ED|nr:BatD family protein [Nitratifractor sp.]